MKVVSLVSRDITHLESLISRIAGNVASGLVANKGIPPDDVLDRISKAAVEIATRIVTEVVSRDLEGTRNLEDPR